MRLILHRLRPPVLPGQLYFLPRRAYSTVPTPPLPSSPPLAPVPAARPSKAETRKSEDNPLPLARPIGLPHPPLPGQNAPPRRRSWSELKRDLTSFEKNAATRERLSGELSKPYFRDLNRLSGVQKGKSFVAPPLLFRRDKALYFPNLWGRTLVAKGADTTDVLGGKVSLVGVFSGAWAQGQVSAWRLDEVGVGEEEEDDLQRVDINVEENWVKAGLVMLFMPSIRKRMAEERWGKYFLVRSGLSGDIRSAMAYSNSKVGYVYLLDEKCRIRWAGSGYPGDGEREAMVRGVKKLVAELKEEPREKVEGKAAGI